MGILLEDRVGLPAGKRAALERAVAAHATLHDVVVWGLAQRPPVVVADVVVQDEYTHDVIVPARAAISGWFTTRPDSAR